MVVPGLFYGVYYPEYVFPDYMLATAFITHAAIYFEESSSSSYSLYVTFNGRHYSYRHHTLEDILDFMANNQMLRIQKVSLFHHE